MRPISGCLTTLVIASAALGQGAPPEFEVASIRPSAGPAVGRVNVGLHIDGAQVSITYLSLLDYLATAYRVRNYQISGPEWLATQRFDIAAKLPADAKPGSIPDMLQALLIERFQLKAHRDSKDFPVYGLVAGKDGLKLQKAPAESAESGPPRSGVNITATGSQAGTSVNLGEGSSFSFGNNRFEGTKLTMANIAETFARFLDRPVLDMTDIKGRYNFTLEVAPEDFRAMMVRSAIAAGVVLPPEAMRALDGASGDSVFSEVERLGLKLESRKSKMDVVVIDSIVKTPTEN